VGDSATLRVRSTARLPPPVPGRAPTAVGSPAGQVANVHRVASRSSGSSFLEGDGATSNQTQPPATADAGGADACAGSHARTAGPKQLCVVI
jgi:hypothetical protein